MSADYVRLTEQEQMWAEMLMEILKDQQIPCTAVPVYGAGMALRAGVRERWKVYVPAAQKEQAEQAMQGLFPEEST